MDYNLKVYREICALENTMANIERLCNVPEDLQNEFDLLLWELAPLKRILSGLLQLLTPQASDQGHSFS